MQFPSFSLISVLLKDVRSSGPYWGMKRLHSHLEIWVESWTSTPQTQTHLHRGHWYGRRLSRTRCHLQQHLHTEPGSNTSTHSQIPVLHAGRDRRALGLVCTQRSWGCQVHEHSWIPPVPAQWLCLPSTPAGQAPSPACGSAHQLVQLGAH